MDTLDRIIIFLGSIVGGILLLILLPTNAWTNIFIVPNILSDAECREIVDAAEEYTSQNGGWLTDRHAHYPTTDIDAFKVNTINEMWSSSLRDRIFRRMAEQFDVPVDWLSMKDLFVVKYDATQPRTQRNLKMHRDSSVLTFNIALNPLTSYEGGGTAFQLIERALGNTAMGYYLDDDSKSEKDSDREDLEKHEPNSNKAEDKSKNLLQTLAQPGKEDRVYPVRVDMGTMITHASDMAHEGIAISTNTRYILIGFVNATRPLFDQWRRFGTFARCVSVWRCDHAEQHQPKLARVHQWATNPFAIPSSLPNSQNQEFHMRTSHCEFMVASSSLLAQETKQGVLDSQEEAGVDGLLKKQTCVSLYRALEMTISQVLKTYSRQLPWLNWVLLVLVCVGIFAVLCGTYWGVQDAVEYYYQRKQARKLLSIKYQ